MKSPYEDTHLRTQVQKLIDLQRQGKFLASPRDDTDAPPIPTIAELGLRRSRYPYDYEADGERFKMDYPAFALILVEGTPPPEWTPQPQVQLATAVIHPDCVTLRLEDGSDPGLSLDLRQEGSDYHFLRRVNANLRADRQPYVCWRLEWSEDVGAQDFAPLSIANESALVFASSAVWSPEDWQLVAALVASPTKELLTAIRATLANNNSKGWITVKGGEHNAFLKGAKRGFVHVSTSLTKANTAGIACTLLHPLTGNPQEEAAEHFYVVVTPSERLSCKFGERLALSISWPAQAEWSEYLLTAGQEAGLVQLLPTAGPDFTAAVRVVKDDTAWQDVIAAGLKAGAIHI